MVVGDGSIRCNGRGEQGKDALAYAPKGFARTQSQLSTHRPSPYESYEMLCRICRMQNQKCTQNLAYEKREMRCGISH